jgi:hypothetical protein
MESVSLAIWFFVPFVVMFTITTLVFRFLHHRRAMRRTLEAFHDSLNARKSHDDEE